MHIPDGFLDARTATAAWALSLAGVGRAVRSAARQLHPGKIPLMGLSAAFIFAGQMLNFPVGAGTSGHLIGSVLAAVLLGPGAAMIVMTTVIVVQALLFADGGVVALGANIFNMAIAATFSGYAVCTVVRKFLPSVYGMFVGIAFGAWISTVAAAICCTGELAWSGTIPWNLGLPAMAGVHMVIGIGEGLITALVIAAVFTTRPELIRNVPAIGNAPVRSPRMDGWIYGAILCIGLLLFITPFAAPWPDGLEHVAASLGFASREIARPTSSLLAGYRLPGMISEPRATVAAASIGAALVLGLSLVLARFLAGKSKNRAS